MILAAFAGIAMLSHNLLPTGFNRSADSDTVCSLNVVDWELSKVLRVLSEQTHVNIVALSSPRSKLTIRLSEVKLSEMIGHICATMKLSWLRSGGTTVIGSEDQLKAAYPAEWAASMPRRFQISILVRVDDVSEAALGELGTRWKLNNLSVAERKTGELKFSTCERSGFLTELSTLELSGSAQLLAEPNLSVLDGEKGMILVGSKINFPHIARYDAAKQPIFERQEEQIGIRLDTSAKLGPTGDIILTLNPRVSTVRAILEAGGASYPQIVNREAITTLRIHPGQTVVVSGLMQDDDLYQGGAMPVLAEMPLLNDLLKHRRSTAGKCQVLLSITPEASNAPRKP